MKEGFHKDPAFAFMKLKKEVKGVKKAFAFLRTTERFENDFESAMQSLTSFLPERDSPKKISIQTHKGEIIVYIENPLLLGAVMSKDANPALVETILARIVSSLDMSSSMFAPSSMETVTKRIEKRIENLCPGRDCATVQLVSGNLKVEGQITLEGTSSKNIERLRREIQTVLREELPFFCEETITITVASTHSP